MIYFILLFLSSSLFAGNVQDYLYQKLHVEFLQKCALKNCNRDKRNKKKLRRYSDSVLLYQNPNKNKYKNSYKRNIAKQLGWL